MANDFYKGVLFFKAIRDLEDKIGILLPKEDLIKYLKKEGIESDSKKIEKMLHKLVLEGILFYPTKDFVQRIETIRRI